MISTGFDIGCGNGAIVSLGIKVPSVAATTGDLSRVLDHLPNLEGLILDNSNISGPLSEFRRVRNPSKLRRLQLRWCNVGGTLEDLSNYTFQALKLSDNISGDIKSLDWSQLEFLDLRNATAVTGNVSNLKSGLVKGLWLQYTQATGDITELMRNNSNLTYLHVQGSEAEKQPMLYYSIL